MRSWVRWGIASAIIYSVLPFIFYFSFMFLGCDEANQFLCHPIEGVGSVGRWAYPVYSTNYLFENHIVELMKMRGPTRNDTLESEIELTSQIRWSAFLVGNVVIGFIIGAVLATGLNRRDKIKSSL